MTTYHARFFKRALQERLDDDRQKTAFVPMTPKQGQQAAGPGGMPVDPAAGGSAPMDPMAGGAPMDPAAMGAGGGAPMPPPMDPMAGGGGAPPLDPMAMGGLPPMPGGEELPPLPGEEELAEGGEGETSISGGDVEALKGIQQNTMDLVRQTLEMVGKAKPQEVEAEKAAEEEAEPPPPEAQPGPVTGQPGFSPDMVSGPLKIGKALKRKLAASAAEMAREMELRNRRLSGLGFGTRSRANRQKAREQGEERALAGKKVGPTVKGRKALSPDYASSRKNLTNVLNKRNPNTGR